VNNLQEKYRSSDVLCEVGLEYESKSLSARDTDIAEPAIAFKAYSAKLSGAALEAVTRSPDVKEIHQNYELEDYVEGEPVGNIVQYVHTLRSVQSFTELASRHGTA
jgi:hypothetical protein